MFRVPLFLGCVTYLFLLTVPYVSVCCVISQDPQGVIFSDEMFAHLARVDAARGYRPLSPYYSNDVSVRLARDSSSQCLYASVIPDPALMSMFRDDTKLPQDI